MHSISVIVPVYNVEKYLEECLNSLVLQTEPFDEILLVNDGSTDASLSICESYAQKYANIQLFSQENKGQAVARNRAMRHAKGEYIVFVDSDDYISLDMVSVLKGKLNEDCVDVLFYAAKKQYDTKSNIKENYEREKYLCQGVVTGREFLKDFPKHYIESPCLGAYKKSFLEKYDIAFPEGVFYEDLVFVLKIHTFATRVACLMNRLYTRRYRDDSTVVGRATQKKCEDMIAIHLMQWEILDSFYKSDSHFKRRFVAWGITKIIFMLYELGVNKEVLNKSTFVEKFFEMWWSLFESEETCWSEKGILLYMLKQLNSYENYICKFFRGRKQYKELYCAVESGFQNEIREKLHNIALNQPSKKIVIYGVGEHTSKLLELYELYYGKVVCNLTFVVTKLGEETTYKGWPLVSCDAISCEYDMIVISSLYYQNDMLFELEKLNVPKEKIKVLYDNNAMYDLIMAWKILN